MVSRRKFFVIFLMMAVLLFLFQFSQVMRESWNHYSHNEYAFDDLPGAALNWDASQREDMVAGAVPKVLFIGDSENEIGKTVTQWCLYTKYECVEEQTLSPYAQIKQAPAMILIDGEAIALDAYLNRLDSYVKYGVPVVFLSLPDVDTVKGSKKLQDYLSITEVYKDKVTVDGIRLFSGSLLGGESIYQAQNEKEKETLQDLDLTMPWYITGKGSKTYMIGLMNEKAYEREKFPRIIWRNSDPGAMIFAVNGDYMKDETGYGFLDMFLYEMSDYALYPVVNAQNTSMIDFPDFSGADEQAVSALYSRSADAVQQDVFWPSIYSMITRNNLKPTCFFMTQFNKDAAILPDGSQVNFYLQQMNEVGAEAGRSMHHDENMLLSEKITLDNLYYKAADCTYDFRAAYVENPDALLAEQWCKEGKVTSINTLTGVASEEYPAVSYYAGDVTLQNVTHDAADYSYSQNLRMKSLLTSLGYSNMLVDFHKVLWPESKDDSWEVYFDTVYSNISTYWSRFAMYDQTTLSQSDYRVRNFLNMDYTQLQNSKNEIYINIRNDVEDTWFLLRTHGQEVTYVQNGEARMIEKDAYLIHVEASHATIHMKEAEEVLKYQGPF